MTQATELLARLRALDVRLSVEGDSLRSSAPRGVLTPELQKELARLKPEIITLLRRTDAGRAPGRPTRMSRQGDVPLSFAQQRLWFLDRLEAGPAYTLAVRWRLHGLVATDALARAFTEVVRRHEALRTTFAITPDGQPIQQINDPYPMTVPAISLVGVAEQPTVLEAHRRAEAERPFDLRRGPLFRAVLFRIGPEEHELVLAVHHIVADGWSLGILAREIHVLYEAYASGRPSPLPEPPLQYADFALWQRQWLQGDVLERQSRYWRARLGDGLVPVRLPTDHARTRQQKPSGASHGFDLSQALTDRLRAVSRSEGATLFMTLLAAFNVLLARYSGQEDIVVGTPVANRNHVELESVIGFFVNTLVLRTNLAGDPTFRQLLARVREVSLGAFAHQDMPFEKLVEELQPDRSLGQNPLFQVSFVFQTVATGAGFDFINAASAFDLTLFVADRGEGGLGATIEYRRDLFEPDTIVRLAEHYRTLLAGVVVDPDRRVSALPLGDPDELNRILVEWNTTATDYPRERSIHGLFQDQAAATPEAVAVALEGVTLTYRELDQRANRLAHYLRSLGVRPERPVGLWMERSLEVVVAILGILKAGGAYAPFDLRAPRERIAFMLRDARIEVLLTQQRMLAGLPADGVRPICLDADQRDIAAQPDTRLPDEATGDSLAYIMYTSGSTGEPKGVAVTHRGVVRLVRGTDYAHFGPDEVILQLAPLSFDASTFEIWGALLNGGRLAVPPPGMLSVDELGALLARHRVTTLWLTAGFFHQVVDQRVEVLGPLRQLLAGGDVLSVPHVRKVLAALPGVRLVNGYGPTEGTTFTCCHRIAGEAGLERSVPIGRPIANTRVYVLDRHRQPVPVGVQGELWIAGDGLARGYVERADLTAERFVTQRLSDRIEERLYRSGDVVRWLPDGTLEFLGRQDTQVKLRGFRVELGEVESTLARHPRVRDVAVIVQPGAGGDKRLVAYVVPDGTLAARDLRDFLGTKLPEYMVPSAFVLLERLPLTPNGKVDRTRLPEPEESREPVETVVLPRNDEERQLVAIWEEVLAVSGIGTRANFFDLGGHSLLALRMFVRLEQSFRIRLPIATLFEAPTIEQLAAVIRQGGRTGQWRSLVAIQPAGSRAPIFAVPGVGGNVLCYSDLARFMVPDQPLYGLQSRGLDGAEQPLTRIEDIAAAFLAEIRAVQPEGPYTLLGTCMGGVVAYEMAQQLHLAGEKVGLLVLLETWRPMAPSGRLPRLGSYAGALVSLVGSRLRLYFQELRSRSGRQQLKYLFRRVRMLMQITARRDVFRGDRSEFDQRVVTNANLLAYQQYKARVYPGGAVLFLAELRTIPAHDDPRLSWRQLLAAGAEIHTVPGHDSGSMLDKPHVQVLAQQLKACIERSRRSTPAAGGA